MDRYLWTQLIIIGAMLGPVGCSDDDGADDGGVSIVEIVRGSSEPAEYVLADAPCQAGRPASPLTLTETKVFAWDGEDVERRTAALAHISSDDALTSRAVLSTTYRDRFVRVCDLAKPNGQECNDERGREKPWSRDAEGSGGKLRLCRDGAEFPRNSYESVGLTSVHYVEKAFTNYANASSRELPKVHLAVLPHFIDYFDNFVDQKDGKTKRLETYITHNLAYFPSSGSTPPLISVFPERKADADAEGFLWESGFVLAHEFGHHIDFATAKPGSVATSLRWNPLTHRYDDLEALGITGSASSARGQIEGMAAEAFADLLAYYSEGASSASLVGLPCFGKNRDISKSSFSNSDDKMLTADRLDLLLGRSEDVTGRCVLRYSDIHTAGAILAYALDQSFQALTSASLDLTSSAEIEARYKLALAFKDELDKRVLALASGVGDQALLEPFGAALAKVTDQFLSGLALGPDPTGKAGKVRAEVCRIMEARLPVATPPYALTGGGCS